MNEENAALQERLARNEAFWGRGFARRPLLGMAVNITFPAVAFADLKADKGRITPDMIHPEEFLADWDRSYEHTQARGEDVLMVASPYAGIPWMEAIVGCDVYASPASSSIWAEHPDPSWDSLQHIAFDPHNPWLLKLVECAAVLREHAGGRYPIGTPIMRGVSDIVAALLGAQRMVLELYDHPHKLRQLLERCAEIWQGVGEMLTGARGLFHGGQCAGRRRVWTPGACILYQDDAAAYLSPKLYQEYFLPKAHQILERYDRSMIHTHSGSLRIMIDALLALESLDAIEVDIDPIGPRVPELVDFFQRIQEHKSLLIIGELQDMSLDDIQLLFRTLSPRGLCILLKVSTEAQADALFDQLVSYETDQV